jgi:flagellar biogenesis protein FliO
VKPERGLRSGMVNSMATEALRISSDRFRRRVIALWGRVLRLSRRTPKGLRLCESLPLGERRFVAVVEFERMRFLLGGTPSSLVLLSRLDDFRNRGDAATEQAGTGQDSSGNAAPTPTKNGRSEC